MAEKRKGLVMEATPGKIVVLTPTGEFKHLAWQKKELPAVGSEIVFETAVPRYNFFLTGKFLALAAGIALFFFAIPFFTAQLFPGNQQVIAYVNIDINPSVELGLDQEGKVREATGLNEDGVKLLEQLQLLNRSAEEAVRLITSEAVKKQYLAPDKENNVILTLSSPDEREERRGEKFKEKAKVLVKIQKVLNEEVKKDLQERKIEVQVEFLEVSIQFHEKAKEQGISPGKYAVILEAREEGLEITPENMKFSSVVKAIKKAGGNPGEIISRTKKAEKQLMELEKEQKKRFKKGNGQGKGQGKDMGLKDKDEDEDELKKVKEERKEVKKEVREKEDERREEVKEKEEKIIDEDDEDGEDDENDDNDEDDEGGKNRNINKREEKDNFGGKRRNEFL